MVKINIRLLNDTQSNVQVDLLLDKGEHHFIVNNHLSHLNAIIII